MQAPADVQSAVDGVQCRTRQEFQQWGNGLGEQFGYSVKFWGAGKAMAEERALTALGMKGQDIGFASQVRGRRISATHSSGQRPMSGLAALIGYVDKVDCGTMQAGRWAQDAAPVTGAAVAFGLLPLLLGLPATATGAAATTTGATCCCHWGCCHYH